jgi:hypothetical protein
MSAKGPTKAISGKVVTGLGAAIIAPVPVLWLTNSSDLIDSPVVEVISVSPLSPLYANNTYSEAQITVDNGGKATAKIVL